MTPISWPYLNREFIHFPSAESSVVKGEQETKTPELELEDMGLY